MLDSLDKELSFNAVLFLGFKIELSNIYELFVTVVIIFFAWYQGKLQALNELTDS